MPDRGVPAELVDQRSSPLSGLLPPKEAALERCRYIADTWREIFKGAGIDAAATIVEVAPGTAPKIGMALADLGFHGTLYLVEPTHQACLSIAKQYAQLLPNARIITLERKLEDAIALLPENVTAVVANHPLDDLLVAKLMDAAQFEDFFGSMRLHKTNTVEFAELCWNLLQSRPEMLKEFTAHVCQTWEKLYRHCSPELLAISQYNSRTLQNYGIQAPDRYAHEALHRLRSILSPFGFQDEEMLRRLNQDPADWLILRHEVPLTSALESVPQAIDRLGAQNFITYQGAVLSAEDVSLLTCERSLAAQYPDLRANFSDDKQFNELLISAFAVDADSAAQNAKEPVTLYSDRQADPLNIAMSGNLGSGRAAYRGSHFNVKGIGRTALATQPLESVHGTGRIGSGKALWEWLAGNVVHYNFRTGGNAVLAVLDLHKDFKLKDNIWRSNIVVREDRGTLDRPTHYFLDSAPLPAPDLRSLAGAFGRQEAEKFIERIVHGAWSAGNISVRGEMLDYSEVSSVKSRAPQFTSCGKYLANFFGFEGRGQRMILKALAEKYGYEVAPILRDFANAHHNHLKERFLDLVGVGENSKFDVLQRFSRETEFLVQEFQTLSGKMYPNLLATDVRTSDRESLHVFDFSRFFRFYPLAREGCTASAERQDCALKLLINEHGNFAHVPPGKLRHDVAQDLLAHFTIENEEQHSKLIARALHFARCYENFLCQLESCDLSGSPRGLATRAYITNEDRYYLESGPMLTTLLELDRRCACGELSNKQFRRFMELLLQANDRRAADSASEERISDMRIYSHGYVCTVITADGLARKRLVIFPESEHAAVLLSRPELLLKLSGEFLSWSCRLVKAASELTFESGPFQLRELLEQPDFNNVTLESGTWAATMSEIRTLLGRADS